MRNNQGIGGGLNSEGGLLEGGGGGLIEDLRYLKRGTGSGEWRLGNGEEGTGNGNDTGTGK